MEAAPDSPGADEVDDDELLWRRIHPKQYVPDVSGEGMRVSSGAFTDPNMSVDRAAVVIAGGRDQTFTKQDGVGVAQFTASFARGLDQAVEAKPVEGNDAHAEVIGDKKSSSRRVAKLFAEECAFLD